MPLPLHSLSAEGLCKVPDVKELLWHKNASLRAPGVGAITLLHDHNCILHMAVCKVNPEIGPTRRPPQAPRYWALEPRQVCWKVDLVSLGLPGGWGGGCPSPVPPPRAVLDLTIFQQRARCYFNYLWLLGRSEEP